MKFPNGRANSRPQALTEAAIHRAGNHDFIAVIQTVFRKPASFRWWLENPTADGCVATTVHNGALILGSGGSMGGSSVTVETGAAIPGSPAAPCFPREGRPEVTSFSHSSAMIGRKETTPD